MISRRGPILILISLLLAVGAAWVANRWLIARSAQEDAGPGTVPVAVAAIDIPFATTVEARHVAVIQMLADTVPEGIFRSAAEVEGKVARSAIMKGEFLLAPRFAEKDDGSILAAVVGENMRAVTVRVNDVVGVAGFLLPGNRVDVVTAYREGQQTLSETVLQNVKVLAVDQTASTDKNEPVVVRAVTLEVTPEDAEKLVLADERGTIQLSLRNPRDEELVAVGPARPAAPPAPAPAPARVKPRPQARAPAPSPSQDVTVIRGTDVGQEVPPKK
jgi:pilus assembly protein CpaB